MHEEKYTIINAQELSSEQLDSFLKLCFNKTKSSFILQNSKWLYNGIENNYVVHKNHKPVGYFGLIPHYINISGKKFKALASTDLHILSDYRGKGIMKTIDNYVRSKNNIIISFPNKNSAKVYKRYGYKLAKDNFIMLFPAKFILLPHYKKLKKYKKYILRFLFFLMEPISVILRKWINNKSLNYSQHLENPSTETLAKIYENQSKNITSIIRNEEFINWRYFKSPFFSQYNFFIGGYEKPKSIVLITRTLIHLGVVQTRIIDIFGNLNDKVGLLDIVRKATQHSIKNNTVYITVNVSFKNIFNTLLKSGFLPVSKPKVRCWHSSSDVNKEIQNNATHWSLADSDNDTFD